MATFRTMAEINNQMGIDAAKELVCKYLDDLPTDTTDAIAAYLRTRGVTGQRVNPSRCVLAQWLSDMTGLYILIGMMVHIRLTSNAYVATVVALPKTAQLFMHEFDAGLFPDLAE
jgi:hypothetical protein